MGRLLLVFSAILAVGPLFSPVPRTQRAEVLDECDFELAVAHLRVPEMV